MEALLLGLEPMTAAVIGVGALVAAPVVGAIDAATGGNLAESAKSATKTGLIWTFQAFEQVQSSVAEASESFQDLIAEARSEMNAPKDSQPEATPREVTIG